MAGGERSDLTPKLGDLDRRPTLQSPSVSLEGERRTRKARDRSSVAGVRRHSRATAPFRQAWFRSPQQMLAYSCKWRFVLAKAVGIDTSDRA